MRPGQESALFSASDPVTSLLAAITWPQLPPNVMPKVHAFLLDAKGHAPSVDHMVGDNQTTSQQGISRAGPGIFQLDLPNTPTSVARIAFALSLSNERGEPQPLSALGEIKMEIRTPQRGVIATFRQSLTKTSQDTVLPGMIYRHGDGWHLKTLGQGLHGGVAELCKRLKMGSESASDKPLAPPKETSSTPPQTEQPHQDVSAVPETPPTSTLHDPYAHPSGTQAPQQADVAAASETPPASTLHDPYAHPSGTKSPQQADIESKQARARSKIESRQPVSTPTASDTTPKYAAEQAQEIDYPEYDAFSLAGLGRSITDKLTPFSFLLPSIVLLCGFIYLVGDGLPMASLPVRGDINLVDIADWRMVVLPSAGLLVVITVFIGRIHLSWIAALPVVVLVVQTLWEVWQHANAVELEAISRFGNNDYGVVHYLVYNQPTTTWGITLLGITSLGLIIASIMEAAINE
ncbi:MAG: TerD family protein [Magnetococcales bacterium]|nr:TerD family protein [Magnetococcales bacterium]